MSVDGKEIGRTPDARIEGLVVGRRYDVVAVREGFRPTRTELVGDGAVSEVQVSLLLDKESARPSPRKAGLPPTAKPPASPASKAKGKLACGTQPAGAEVWVDGKDTHRQTPVSLSQPLLLPVGPHQVTFRLRDKQSGPHEVEVVEDEVVMLRNIPLE